MLLVIQNTKTVGCGFVVRDEVGDFKLASVSGTNFQPSALSLVLLLILFSLEIVVKFF